LSKNGFYYFKLDNEDYSLFSYEQEVLILHGSKFIIEEITEKYYQGHKYYTVQLKFTIFWMIINNCLFKIINIFKSDIIQKIKFF
jgi:hypothetical protein